MVRNGLILCGVLAFCIVGLHTARSQDRAMSTLAELDGGVFVTPVPGISFSAIAEQEMTQALKDGTSFQRKTSAVIARDFQGRIHNEMHEILPVSATRNPRILTVHIYDPNTRLNTFLNPYTHIARQRTLLYPPNTAPPSDWAQREPVQSAASPNRQFEDLGTNVLEGTQVHGYRRTMTLDVKTSGTGEPVVVTDEYWYSEEFHLNMLSSHDDPRTGKLTITVTHFNRGEPSADLFQIPANYKLVDITPPSE